MRLSHRLLVALTLSLLAGPWSRAALAGPNAGGTLILHQCLEGCLTTDGEYCGFGDLPLDCAGANTEHDGTEPTAWHVFAAFSEASSPRLQGITFGVDYDAAAVTIVEFGSCGDFEISTPTWPEPGSGTAITWSAALTSPFVEVCWFVGYDRDSDPDLFELAPHPQQGGFFADDAIPSHLDPIAAYGRLGFNGALGSVPCPGDVVGACCFLDGSCEVLPRASCEANGGTTQGADTVCQPNPCPQPRGACCLAVGSCQYMEEDDCAFAGGVYQGDFVPCEPDLCPIPSGACCFADGSCQEMAPLPCRAAHGDYAGDDVPCAPNPCPQPMGACCFLDGTCQVLEQLVCADAGGDYQGTGTVCEPNPCPQPHGACCFWYDGHCTDVFPEDCEDAGGDYQGDYVLCVPNPCPQPPVGACCFDDGACRQRTPYQCVNQGGEWLGVIACTPNPCPQPPIGACCFPNGSCQPLDEYDCDDVGGNFVGVVPCQPNPCPQPPLGACCFLHGECSALDTYDCAAAGGDWQGAGTVCNPNPCPQPDLGACCFGDLHCEEILDVDCDLLGGVFYGAGSLCADVICRTPCPSPATNATTELSTPAPSRSGPNRGGVLILHSKPGLVYSGSSDFCGEGALPACEAAFTSTASEEEVVIHVLAAFSPTTTHRLKSVSFGLQYPECISVFDSGVCGELDDPMPDWPASGTGTTVTWNATQTTEVTEVYWFAAYVGGDQAAQLELAPHPQLGAIFESDDTPPQVDPISALGAFGFHTPGRRPCPVRWTPWFHASKKEDPAANNGACCIEDACVQLSASECHDGLGEYHGDGSVCEPVTCAQVPTIESTWGQIKQRFQMLSDPAQR